MIEFKKGNIFDTNMKCITIPVNCGGVAGAGLSEQMKKLYPDVSKVYIDVCKNKSLSLGYPLLNISNEYKQFLFFPTKEFWWEDSRIEWIESGLEKLVRNIKMTTYIESIALPALGCGFGLLKWEDVKPLMIKYLEPLDIPIEIYEPCPEREQNDRKYLNKVSRNG